MKVSVLDKSFNYRKYKAVFERTFDIISKLGPGVFHSKNKEFSTAIYDTTVIGIAENLNLYSGAKERVILAKVDQVKNYLL